MKRTAVAYLLTTFLVVGQGPAAGPVYAQVKNAQSQPSPARTRTGSGSDLYFAYCSSCHGKGAEGDGPAASALKGRPADLTLLAARNRGKFPRDRVSQTIRGELATTAHGSSEMPVWGPYFLLLSGADDNIAEQRINLLVNYIESIQTRVEARAGVSRTMRGE